MTPACGRRPSRARAAHFPPQLGALAFQRVMKRMFGMGEPDATKVDEALAGFRRFGAVLNGRLGGRRFVVGDALTLADLTLASSLMYARPSEAPLAEFLHLEAWFGRMSDLDAWKKTSP